MTAANARGDRLACEPSPTVVHHLGLPRMARTLVPRLPGATRQGTSVRYAHTCQCQGRSARGTVTTIVARLASSRAASSPSAKFPMASREAHWRSDENHGGEPAGRSKAGIGGAVLGRQVFAVGRRRGRAEHGSEALQRAVPLREHRAHRLLALARSLSRDRLRLRRVDQRLERHAGVRRPGAVAPALECAARKMTERDHRLDRRALEQSVEPALARGRRWPDRRHAAHRHAGRTPSTGRC